MLKNVFLFQRSVKISLKVDAIRSKLPNRRKKLYMWALLENLFRFVALGLIYIFLWFWTGLKTSFLNLKVTILSSGTKTLGLSKKTVTIAISEAF